MSRETRERWKRAKALFQTLRDLPGHERVERLAAHSVDAALRSEVESLLAAHDAGPTTTFGTGPVAEAAGTRIGRFKLLQKIGEGGFGVVFLAEQEQPVRRRVAVKIIKLGMDTRQVVARFDQERQALAMMDHPHIARVLDAGATDSGRPYFVMEYVIGDPVTAFADAHRLSVRERLELFAQVCGAIQHAHTKGVIHRDLKPRNVLVSMSDGRPFAKVIDFGIAKATGARLTEMTLFTEHRQLIGTPEYMSPEQAEGSADIDTRSDVYSLGVMLYELLTGATPFDGQRLRSAAYGELQRIIREEEPPAPSVRLVRGTGAVASAPDAKAIASIAAARGAEPARLGALVRGELDWIALKALDKDRARRYESASQLAADVQRYLSGEPVLAAPPSTAYRVRKFVRKHKTGVTLTTAVGAALVLGAVGTTMGFIREGQQRRVAQQAALSERAQREEADWRAYSTNLASAQVAMGANDWPTARERLAACEASKRGWEWEYLSRQAASIHAVLSNGELSPDGRKLVGVRNGAAAIYDVETGRPIGPELRAGDKITRAEFSTDSTRVLTFNDEQVAPAHLWDADTGAPVAELRPENGVVDATFSPDSMRLATGSFSGASSHLWDALTGRHLMDLRPGVAIFSKVFSKDGSRLVIISHTGPSQVWDLRSMKVLELLPENRVGRAMFCDDSSRLLTLELRPAVQLWNANTGDQLLDERRVSSASFSKDSRRLLVWSHDPPRGVQLRDPATGEMVAELHSEEGIDYALFSDDSRRILTWNTWEHRRAHLWDAASGQRVAELNPENGLIAAFFSPNSARVLSWSGHAAQVWDAATGKRLVEFRLASQVRGAMFSDDSESVLTWDGVGVQRWDAASGCCVGDWTATESALQGITYCLLAGGGAFLFVSGPTCAIVPASLDGPEARIDGPDADISVRTVLGEHPAWGQQADLPAADRRARLLGNGALLIEQLSTGRELVTLRPAQAIAGLAAAQDGRLVLRLSDDAYRVLDPRPPAARQADRDARYAQTSAARELCDELLGGPAPTRTLIDRLRADESVAPLRRRVALGLLRDRLATIEGQAEGVLRNLKSEHVTPQRVQAAAAEVMGLPPRVFDSLQRQAANWRPDADELQRLACQVAEKPGASPQRLAAALEAAQEALRLRGEGSADDWITLAAVQHRLGEFYAAIDALAIAEALDPGHHFHPLRTLCFIALGRTSEAEAALARVWAWPAAQHASISEGELEYTHYDDGSEYARGVLALGGEGYLLRFLQHTGSMDDEISEGAERLGGQGRGYRRLTGAPSGFDGLWTAGESDPRYLWIRTDGAMARQK